MANFDLKTALGSIAPTLATMLGGPFAGAAVSALTAAFGLTSTNNQDKDIASITKLVQGGQMTPDIVAAVRAADQKHAEEMSRQQVDLAKINADHDAALAATFTADTQNARGTFGNQKSIFDLGLVILFTFAVVMGAVLYACYQLLTGGITIHDVAAVAAISGMVGSIVGYVAANAQQVVNYFYGSSHGSAQKTEALSSSVSSLISASTSNPLGKGPNG